MSSRLRALVLIWVTLLLIAAGVLGWLFFVRGLSFDIGLTPSQEQSDISTVPAEILYSSTAYQEIAAYKSLGEISKVRQLFADLQNNYATGTPEREVIDFDLAFYLTFSSDDAAEGIVLLQEIANDEKNSVLTRALAMETLGRAVFTFNNASLNALIFGQEPFNGFLSESQGDYSQATYLLFEAAVEMHPTALAALRSAQVRSYELQRSVDTLSEADAQRLRDEYKTYMSIADKEALTLSERPIYNSYLAEFYSIKGLTLAAMYFAGESVFPEEVTELFKKSIALSQGSEQSFVFFNYAAFLSQAKTVPPEEVDSIIARLQELPIRNRRLLNTYIINSLTAQTGGYEKIENLRKYSPIFNGYVGSLTTTP